MLSSDHNGHLLSFDGAPSEMGPGAPHASSGASRIVAATGHFLEKATANEAEYAGLVKGTQLALNAGIQELVVVGDSRLAIQQLQGVIGCTQPHLLRLLQEAEGLQAKFKSLRLVHVKRNFNAAADYISKRIIQKQSSLEVTDLGERKLLQGLNRIHEKLMKDPSPREQSLMECAFIATARGIPRCSPVGETFVTTRSASEQSNPEGARRERWRRICSHQAHDPELAPLVNFLRGETEQLTLRQTTHLAKIADYRNTPERPRDAADRLRLVVPQDFQEDILHHCHADLQGAHQGFIRTYERLCKEFYWIGMFKDTE
ncbi:LOW QUALITY PROTEIN: reverse transcriptase [Phytophthora megakarya]|uniref:Reverse transcriptase n=1 Tax=Phytophthora megakarya TaxID=4795 RepID=A0A225VRP6_9STRA|nr:LOW QUALITY PROTEIN: reverse transcriptase [Phytophthora megakarya]